jgi:hypothetical protein
MLISIKKKDQAYEHNFYNEALMNLHRHVDVVEHQNMMNDILLKENHTNIHHIYRLLLNLTIVSNLVH